MSKKLSTWFMNDPQGKNKVFFNSISNSIKILNLALKKVLLLSKHLAMSFEKSNVHTSTQIFRKTLFIFGHLNLVFTPRGWDI